MKKEVGNDKARVNSVYGRVALDVIDVNSKQLKEVEIKGHYGVFTALRVDKSTIPEGVNCYEFRHGDDDSYPVAIEQSVRRG